jgi:hypothetical protein
MARAMGPARVGRWYVRWEEEIFRVTGYDEDSHTVEIETLDGDLDEIDEEAWAALSLESFQPDRL